MAIPVPLDRVAWFLTVTALLLGRRTPDRRLITVRGVHIAMLVYCLIAATSAIWWGTVSEPRAGFALLDRVLMPSAAFILCGLALSTAGARELLGRALTGLGIYLGAMSIFSLLGPEALVWPRYILDPDVGIHFGRARGPMLESAANGLSMGICMLSALALGVRTSSLQWRMWSVLSASLCAIGALLTYTRSVWLGVLAGLMVFCFSVPVLRRRLHIYGPLLGGAVAVILLAIEPVRNAVIARATEQAPIDDRANTNAAAVELALEYPLTGVGWGRFLDVVADTVRQLDLSPLTNINIEAHNVLLARAAELGIPGAVAWLSVFLLGPAFAGVRRASEADLQTWRIAIRAIAVAYLCVAMFTPLSYPFPNIATLGIAGMVVSDYQLTRSGRRDSVAWAGSRATERTPT